MSRRWIAVVVLILAATARILLFSRYPIFLTLDSSDFLKAAEAIAHDLDFFSVHLRDWRLPGYPSFLALVVWLTPWASSWLVAVQSLLGLATTAVALDVGRRVAGVPGLLCLGLFVGLNPAYLLLEHMVMSESLFVFLLWIVVRLVVTAMERGTNAGFGRGAMLGLAVAAAILVRSNGVFFCFPLLAIAWLSNVWRDVDEGPGPRRARWRGAIRRGLPFAVGAGLAVAAVWGAWIVRNQIYLGAAKPFTDNANRSRVVFLAKHGLLRPDLPEIAPYEFDPEQWSSTYDLILRQLPRTSAEATARRIVKEQVYHQRWQYLAETVGAAGHFFGLPGTGMPRACRGMETWFRSYVLQQDRLQAGNEAKVAGSSLRLDRDGRQGRVLRGWRRAGLLYLGPGRTFLALGALACTAAWPLFLRRRGVRRRDWLVASLLAGLSLVVFAHGAILADHDRYAVPFDGFVLLCAATVLAGRLGSVRASSVDSL